MNKKYMDEKNCLGCQKSFKRINGVDVEVEGLKAIDFICGVSDGWGKETLCLKCDAKLKTKWKKEAKK